ncbi:MAG: hypothetical protein R3B90_21860 [Planctomycetaceae bacterium]
MDELETYFTYHPPTAAQLPRYVAIRSAGLAMARAIVANVPAGPDRSAAIRKIREAVMTANAGIACEPRPRAVGEHRTKPGLREDNLPGGERGPNQ